MNNNLEKIANFKSLECNTVNFTDEMSYKKKFIQRLVTIDMMFKNY